jgi:hypothetical protein
VSEDASLDEFLDAGGDNEGSGDDRSPDGEAGDRDGEADDRDHDGGGPATDDAADGASADVAESAGDDGSAPDDDSTPVEDPLDDVDPAAATATWSPDGAACAACGTVVERRWRDGEDLVCGDCKEW